MRRPAKNHKRSDFHRTGDIKRDLSEKQLAAIGAATLAYNVLEDQLDNLLLSATEMPIWLFPEMSSRINGLEGKVHIIQVAIENAAMIHGDGLAAPRLKELSIAVAEFMDFKRDRDAIMHARILNAPANIGATAKQRGKTGFEVLLSKPALDSYYEHVIGLEKVLWNGADLLSAVISLNAHRISDPNTPKLERLVQLNSNLFRQYFQAWRSLPPKPKFPAEDEIQQAVNLWREALRAQQRGWMSPLSQPMPQKPFHPQAGITIIEPLLPPAKPRKGE